MKKILLIALALFAGAQAHAQLAVEAGYQHAFENWKVKSLNLKAETPMDGFYAGVRFGLHLDNLVDGLSFVPGADLSFLFGKSYIGDHPITEVAVNVPLQFRYSYDIVDDFSVFGLFGPTLQYGLYHQAFKGGTSYNLYSSRNDLNEIRKRFQTYLSFGAGFEVAQMIQVKLGFDVGLLNLTPENDLRATRHLLKVGAAYLF